MSRCATGSRRHRRRYPRSGTRWVSNEQADEILGTTPLVRVGLAPKHIRVYRADDDHIRSRKLHPIEIFSGSGMFVGFGWHAKADRPYVWPQESPLTLDADSRAIPAVTRAQLERFTHEVFKVVPAHGANQTKPR